MEDRGARRDRALVRAAGSTVIARLGSALCIVAVLGLAARTLSQPELGVVAVLTSLTLLLGFTDFGLGNVVLTRLPAAHARGDVNEQHTVMAVVLASLTVVGLVVGVTGSLSAYTLDWPALLGVQEGLEQQTRAAVLAFFVVGAVAVPGAVGARVLAAMQRTAQVQIWNLSASVLSLLGTAGCAACHAPMWVFVATIAGVPAVAAAVQTLWVLYRALPELRPASLRVPLRTVGGFLRSASLFAVLSLSTGISYAIDAVVVSAVLGAQAAAVFALAARLFSLVGSTFALAGLQLWSALSEAIARRDLAWARSRYLRALLISTAITSTACLLLVAVGKPATRVWTGDQSLVPTWGLLLALAAFTIYQTATVQASYLLTAVEKVGVIAAAGVLGTAVNLLASIWLTHRYGVVGPALGSLVALVLIVTPTVAVLSWRLLRELAEVPA